MTKCVKITCTIKMNKGFAENLLKQARKLSLEGTIHVVSDNIIKIIACGPKEHIDSFVDALYKEGASKKQFSIEVEPFLKDKDYRGVFRIIA